MNWNININQKAIAELNESLKNKLDLKDATILEWMMKFHAEPKSRKLMLNDHVYFWASYSLIIKENPLLEITNKEVISRRISKIIDAGLLCFYLADKEGNKTYFSVKQKCFDLLKRGVSTQKSNPIDLKVDTLSTQKSNNNNIINNINSSSIGIINANVQLIENIAMKLKRKPTEIIEKIPLFINHCKGLEIKHNNNSALFTHFSNWINKQSFDADENKVDWFIRMFNGVSKQTFKATDEVKKLFEKQLANGFTGEEMKTACKNMYSSDPKNKFHLNNGYQFATPTHLLKDDNVNKYLNQRF